MTSAGKVTLVTSLAVVLPFVGLVAWRTTKPHGPSASPHSAVVIDRSASTLGACEAAGGLVKLALAAPGLTKHSTLLVLATGDEATLGEPVEVVRLTGFKSGRAMEAPAEAEKRAQALVQSIVTKCNALPRSSVTAVFLASKRAAEHLRALGCREGMGCLLLVQTDGEENAETSIRRALSGTRASAELPAPIDNTGISTTVCGFAATTGRADRPAIIRRNRNAERVGRITETWRRLFAAPDLATFEPICPKVEAAPREHQLVTRGGLGAGAR